MKHEPQVMILMGSDSDLPVMKETIGVLDRFSIPWEVHVASAHRTPERTTELVREGPGRGVRIFICGAGAAAHLAGAVAAQTTLPVIGVPLSATDLKGLDALLATVQMPAGIPVATVAIGKMGAANAGWLAASMLSMTDPSLQDQLTEARREMAVKVEAKSGRVQASLAQLAGE